MGYFERALLFGALVGLLTGLVGTVTIVRGRVFFAQALSHATFPGAILAAVAGVDMIVGAGFSGLVLLGMMVLLGRIPRQGMQVATGIVLTAGFALGMVLQALNPQIPIRPETVLLGNILFVTAGDVALVSIALAIALGMLAAIRRPLLFSTFDPDGFRASGGREWVVEGAALLLIMLTTIVAIPATGSLLAIALIAGPPAAAGLLTRSWVGMIVVAPVLGAAVAVCGVLLSRTADMSASGTIAILSGSVFVLALAVRRYIKIQKARPRL